ncbi:MAG: transporter substrate-binding domain-containing protein [Oscillospiraceae bacterium]|jgi:L-cystine transport system substrate-binding protein|nr:transporter substrate-binding domain-containing protein [Oscillospiraceae bacterium]
MKKFSIKFKTLAAVLAVLTLLVGMVSLTGCKKVEDKKTTDGVTTVKIGFVLFPPVTTKLDDGTYTGVDIEALKKADELLPQYTFEFVEFGEQNAVFAALESGKIDIATTNSFYTEQRAEKYLIPKENLGMNIEGVFVNTKYPGIKTLEDAADAKLKFAPMLPGDGNHYIMTEFNRKNPDKAIEIPLTDNNNVFMDQFSLIATGQYDFGIGPKQYYELLVLNEDGPLHQYAANLYFEEFGSVRTWPILQKGAQKLADDLDGALKQLKDDGTLSALSVQFIGYDTWAFKGDNVY